MAFKNFWVQYKYDNQAHQSKVDSEHFIIGRSPECELKINTDVVSRKHLQVDYENEKIFITDLGSTNGTFLNGRKIQPHIKAEYKTGDRLSVESESSECTFRIIIIKDQQTIDAGLDEQQLALAKTQQQIKIKNKKIKKEIAKENYIRAASESVDNIFENLRYVVKSARFNKEKAIKEAEYQSQEMLENAKKEIEDYKLTLEQEISNFQQQTKDEAKRIINTANTKAQALLADAKKEAQRIEIESENNKAKTMAEADQSYQDIISKAQEKYSDIIAEAHKKNSHLKSENEKFVMFVSEHEEKSRTLISEIKELHKEKQNFEKNANFARRAFEIEQGQLDELRSKVMELEKRGQAAQKVFDERLPHLQETVNQLKSETGELEKLKVRVETERNNFEQQIEFLKKDLIHVELQKSQQEKRLDELHTKIIEAEDNLFRISELKKQRTEEIEKEVDYRRQQQKREEELSNKEIEKRVVKSDKEIAVNLERAQMHAKEIIIKAQVEAQQTLNNAKNQATEWIEDSLAQKQKIEQEAKNIKEETTRVTSQQKLDAQLDANHIKYEAQLFADDVINKAKAEAKYLTDNIQSKISELKEKAMSETENLRSSILTDAQKSADQLYRQSNLDSENLIRKSRKESEELLSRSKNESEQLLSTAQKESSELLTRSQSESEKILSLAKKQSAEWLEQSEKYVNQTKSDLEKELETKKKEHQEEVQQMRVTLVRNLEEQKKILDMAEKERTQNRAAVLKKELGDVLRARISPFLKEPAHVDRVHEIIGKSINAVLLDQVDETDFSDLNFSDFDPTLQQNKVKKFWISTGAALMLAFLFLVYLPKFKNMAVETTRTIAAEADKNEEIQLEQVRKENELKKEFKPEKTDQYYSSYTERVLYTRDYVKIELKKEFREKWILSLQDYFVHGLRLNENNLVPFIAQEANLIRELDEMMAKINGQFAEEGIQRMRDIEAIFVKKIRENIKKPSDFKKIMNFKQKFFLENASL